MEEIILIFIRTIALFLLLFATVVAAEIVPAKNAVVTKIEWTSPEMEKRFSGTLRSLVNKPFDNLTLKIQLDQIS